MESRIRCPPRGYAADKLIKLDQKFLMTCRV